MNTNNLTKWPSPKAFVEVWQRANSLREVASSLKMTKAACSVRASRYRSQGVPLKEFPPLEMPKTDWDELAEYAKGLIATDGASEADAQTSVSVSGA
jgi:hypothetical protein